MKTATYFNILFIILIYLGTEILSAQDQTIVDSLNHALKFSQADTSKVNTLISLASEYSINSPKKAIEYGKEALALAKELNFDKGIGEANQSLGVSTTNTGNYTKATKYLLEGLRFSKKVNDKWTLSRTYNSLGVVYFNQGNYQESIKYHLLSKGVKEELSDRQGLAFTFNNISYNYYALGKYSIMRDYCMQALKILEEVKDSVNIAEVYNVIGVSYYASGNYPEAIRNYLLSLKKRETFGDKQGMAACYINIGGIYQELKNYSDALQYFDHSIKLFREIGDTNNIATVQYSIGTIYMYQEKYDEALDKFFSALKIKKVTGDKNVEGLLYSSIGEVYYLTSKYENSLKYYLDGLKIANEIGDKRSTAMSLTGVGKVYTKKKKFKEAKQNLDEGLKISKSIGDKEVMKVNYEALAELSGSQNDYKNQVKYFKEYSIIKDSLLNENNNKQVAELKTIFETEKKEKENLALKNENIIKANENTRQEEIKNVIVISSIIIILLLTFGFYNFYKRRKILFTRTVEMVNNKALRSQMNPHFIFNALQSIQTFLLKNSSEDANIYLIKFSKLMRLVLENSQHQEVSLIDDVEALELYMQLESIRLKFPFTYEFHIDADINMESTKIPPLILQPFVENAIWHGLQYKNGSGHINITISKKGEELYCAVEDNGIGRDLNRRVEKPMLIKKESMGMKLTEERLKILNELKKFRAHFKIIDLKSKDDEVQGTRIELSLPLAS